MLDPYQVFESKFAFKEEELKCELCGAKNAEFVDAVDPLTDDYHCGTFCEECLNK